MTNPANQKGFAIIEAVLIVLILVIGGATGYLVWHTKQNAEKSLNAADAAAQDSVIAPKAKTVTNFAECKASKGSVIQLSYPETCVTKDGKRFANTSVSVDNSSYLTIKEWDVKIPLTGTISNAYYAYENGYVYLSIENLKNTACAADKVSLGAIERFTSADINEATGETYISMFPYLPKVGSYYYHITKPQAACSDDPAIVNIANASLNAFLKQGTKIQAE